MADIQSTPPSERLKFLSAVGSSVEIKKDISPMKYFRSGVQMESVARTYIKEGDLERAYKMLHKFITLFVEKLPQHPLYATVDLSKKKEYKKKVDDAFTLAADIKRQLSDRYHSEYQVFLEEQKRNEMMTSNKVKSLDEYGQDYLQQVNVDSTTSNGQLALRDNEEGLVTCNRNSEETSDLSCTAIVLENQTFGPNTPTIDRSLKPAVNKNEIALAVSDGLRSVRVPHNLSERFLTLAQENTAANIETCGILGGFLAHDGFKITHVVIPKQTGTADSCTTEEEEQIFDFLDSRSLITLGWIHTHPSQTSFLSSVDLHTQYTYQILMPEAIAIVCAPSYKQTGYFTLTRDHGLRFIGKCKEVGFHPHPSHPSLFEDCKHIFLDAALEVQFADFRSH